MMDVHNVVKMNVMTMAAPPVCLDICCIYDLDVLKLDILELVYATGFFLHHRLGDYSHRNFLGWCDICAEQFHQMLQCPAKPMT